MYKSKRVRRQEKIWLAVIIVLATPMVLSLLLATAMSLAGCADPGVVCNLF